MVVKWERDLLLCSKKRFIAVLAFPGRVAIDSPHQKEDVVYEGPLFELAADLILLSCALRRELNVGLLARY